MVQNLPIRQKLVLLVMGSSFLALWLAFLGFSLYERAQFRTDALAKISTLADTLGSNSAASVAFDDANTAQQMLDALAQNSEIEGAYLYDTQSHLFARYDRRVLGQNEPAPTLDYRDGARFHDNMLIFSKGIYLKGDRTGSILIVASLDGLQVKLHRFLLIASFVFFVSIVLTYLASTRLILAISKPIVELAKLASKVGTTNDYSLRAPAGGLDEVGRLIAGFNGMLEKVHERDLALHEANNALEVRVAERTSELMKEIAERKQAEADLLYEVYHDSLTHLANRRYFVMRLSEIIEFTNTHAGHKFAILFVDIDRFKTVNDSIGHVAGDELIKEIAKRLCRCVVDSIPGAINTVEKADEAVARIGGDEFVIILNPIEEAANVAQVAERILKEFAAPFEVLGEKLQISASIGGAISAPADNNAKDLLTDADTAMYEAKALGPGQYRLCDPEMHREAVSRLRLETDMRRALQLQQFRVFYQPVISLATNRIVGFETLLRWERPGLGMVSPETFISLAEDTGLILQLGLWVMRQACEQINLWNQQFNQRLKVCVNVSAKQFHDPHLPEQVAGVLRDVGLLPELLTLEVTESLTMIHADQSAIILRRLKEMGMGLSCDDFGTGFSSLSYLHHFPLDTLKIDRSFISGEHLHRDSREIVEAIVTLGHKLGMELVAEGVETADQADWIKSLGCEYAQGYFYSKPVPADSIARLLDQSFAQSQYRGDGRLEN